MLELEQCGLLVVDVQGKLARQVQDSAHIIGNIGRLIRGFQALGLPIICLEQYPDGLGATVPELAELLGGAPVIAKTSFGGCGSPAFLSAAAATGRRQWLVCGIETHICVYQTARGMRAEGFEVEVIADAVSSRRASDRDMALQRLQANGINLSSVEMSLYELVRDSKSPAFKQLLPIIKE